MRLHFKLNANSRGDMGRGASRRLRRDGLVPVVIYGADKPAESAVIDHNLLVNALANEAFYTSIVDMHIDGVDQQVIIKDLQRHPFKPKILHVDFLRISDKTELRVHIPLHFVGESPAVKAAGVINHMVNEVEVSCLPKDLPAYIEVDLSNLQMDESIHLSQLILPAGLKLVTLMHGNDLPVVSVHVPRAVKEDEEAPAEAAEGAEGGAEAAKSADAGKKPAEAAKKPEAKK
ncbi:MAG: ribosomal protein L25/ral stress protein Ctc [Gammaproteobacteria bacterium]|jgi:large subunit ribosomal protein L25|nr:ribosomal protein L25/ral stress protein Ctc [Gammaproteobacteria bacterium]